MGSMLTDILSLWVIDYVFMYSLCVLHPSDFHCFYISGVGWHLHVCLPCHLSSVFKTECTVTENYSWHLENV